MVGRYRKKDPYKAREADKYQHPVPSREFILQYMEEVGRPATLRHLLDAFNIEADDEAEGMRRRLRAMERDGQLISNRRGSYALVAKMDLVRGRVQGHRDGFGFLIVDEGDVDVFLPAREMRGIFSNDRVLVRITQVKQSGRREGVVVEVLERNTTTVAGRFFREGELAYVGPDSKIINQDIIIPPKSEGNAKSGQYVEVEIVQQPKLRRQPTGKVIAILGDDLTPGMEIELAVRSHSLPCQFSSAVKKETAEFATKVSDADLKGRSDLRDLPFVTIDGADAKDFDDAVYCKPVKDGGWCLYVAIADVANYVLPGSELDAEAQERGNSVYFPNRVLPMLPDKLSNGLCSLKPNQDRLALICEMKLNVAGELIKSRFYEGVIHSHARLTYTEVAAVLAGATRSKHEKILPHLKDFEALFQELLRRRADRGAIEFDSVETEILFDEQDKISKIVPRTRNIAHRMIEEAMLLANVCAAKFIEKAGIQALYRNHECPDVERIITLRDFLKTFGLRLTGGDSPTGMDYTNLLARIKERPDRHLLETVMLRSLRQARYETENKGHFGLSYEGYLHFTSPIRRYPDLIVHRAIKHLIRKIPVKKFIYTQSNMETMGAHFSMTERRADLATRDATDWLKCDYMTDKVGETYEGIIVDVTGFGVFVELKDIYIQGLLHITSLLNDYYQHDSAHHLLRGKRSGKTYQLGDPIKVLVARVDLDERQIDFELAK